MNLQAYKYTLSILRYNIDEILENVMNLVLKILIIVISIIVVIALALPSILNLAGLHHKFNGNSFDLEGKKALIIATNHGVLNKPGEIE